ncbi:MAG TPA: hypothetical protein VFI90_17240 [Rubrobacter sp.]|nr:hypothetical protein [Rubrobacter sp.]
MIRISVEVGPEDTGFRVTVRADSIEQALRITNARYSGSEVRVVFPIKPDTFFVAEETTSASGALRYTS